MQLLSQHVPAMITQHSKVMQKHGENEGKFYTRWPDIDKATHGPAVSRLAAIYRKMNPGATLDSMIEDLGPIVMMQAKIVPGAPRPSTGPAPVGANGRPPQPSPFVPATGGMGAPIPAAGSEDGDPWGAMDPRNQG